MRRILSALVLAAVVAGAAGCAASSPAPPSPSQSGSAPESVAEKAPSDESVEPARDEEEEPAAPKLEEPRNMEWVAPLIEKLERKAPISEYVEDYAALERWAADPYEGGIYFFENEDEPWYGFEYPLYNMDVLEGDEVCSVVLLTIPAEISAAIGAPEDDGEKSARALSDYFGVDFTPSLWNGGAPGTSDEYFAIFHDDMLHFTVYTDGDRKIWSSLELLYKG